MTRTTPPLSFHEVTPDRWPDLERLFSAKGGPAYCWCMPFRDDGGAAKKSAMRERVLGGTPVGLLAYRDEEPIAWCSVAPKATFERLGKDAFKDTSDLDVTWSITCFFVPRAERRQGMVGRLIDAAIDVARQHGARVVEAYPVDVDSPSYRFGGFVRSFERAGFEETGRLGTRRHVVRRRVRPRRGR